MAKNRLSKSGGTQHGSQLLRGFDDAPGLGAQLGPMIQDCAPYFKEGKSDPPPGRFGRLFPTSDYAPDFDALTALAGRMEEHDLGPGGQHSSIPIGLIFLGQFIDHDITFDATTFLARQADPQATRNFRSPNLDLDSLYGFGPDVSRHLYDLSTPDQHQLPYRLLLDEGRRFDLPRNSQQCALIGDPRNDENFLISQLHLAFIKFHNAVVDAEIGNGASFPQDLPFNKKIFEHARQVTLWHYQWIVLHEFLPLIVGQEMASDVLENGPLIFKWDKCGAKEPFIPAEFGAAAYRMGHTLLRETYKVAAGEPVQSLFDLPFFGVQRPEFTTQIEWPRFFDLTAYGALPPQFARRFDTKLAPALHKLPFINEQQDPPISLPDRNMRRGTIFRLPSGQEAVDHINAALTAAGRKPIEKFSNADLGINDIDGIGDGAPLWFYILAESEKLAAGERLGPTGGRIVAEVLTELLRSHAGNYLHDQPDWTPTLPAGKEGDFTMADLIRFAGA